MSISGNTAAIVSGTALVIHGALKRGPAGAASIGVGGILAWFALRPEEQIRISGRQLLRASHTIDLDPYGAFLHWQDLSQLPSAIKGFGSVKQLDNGNWRLPLPGGAGNMEVQLTHEQPGHVIEWRTLAGAKINGRGVVRFTRKKNGRGTKVHMEWAYEPAAA